MTDDEIALVIAALPLREQPSQKRSRRTVMDLLAAARSVVETDGVRALSTQAVAEAAGTPIGTVYRYFPDREGLVEALVAWHRFDMDAVLLEQVKVVGLADWRGTIRALIAASAAFARERPGYLPLRAMASAAALERAAGATDRWVSGIVASPAMQMTGMDPEVARRHATVAVGAIQGVMPQLYTVDEDQLDGMIDATAKMVCTYVASVAADHGIPLP